MPDTREISLKEHIEKIFGLKVESLRRELDIRFEALAVSIEEAKRIMELKMAGFPAEFVKKGDSDVAITEMKSKVDMVAMGINKLDLLQILPRAEYTIQHKALQDRLDMAANDLAAKLERAATDLADRLEMARSTLDDKNTALKENLLIRFEALDKKVQEGEVVRANIMGRILGTGAAILISIAVIQLLLHYVWR